MLFVLTNTQKVSAFLYLCVFVMSSTLHFIGYSGVHVSGYLFHLHAVRTFLSSSSDTIFDHNFSSFLVFLKCSIKIFPALCLSKVFFNFYHRAYLISSFHYVSAVIIHSYYLSFFHFLCNLYQLKSYTFLNCFIFSAVNEQRQPPTIFNAISQRHHQ